MDRVFFDDWEGLTRTLVVGVLAYMLLVLTLRGSGKRTPSKMNAFDLIVTVALGSMLATVTMSKEVALAEGVLAFTLLIALQFAVTWLSVRVPLVRRLATGEPQALLRHGVFLSSALRSSRVTENEVLAAVRSAGLCDLEAVEAVVLETDGSFSVVSRAANAGTSTTFQIFGFGAG